MKFSAKQDIEAPIAFVFQSLSDFEAWERAGMRRGAEIARSDKLRSVGPGMSWKVSFMFRGKQRKMDVQLVNITAPSKLEFSALSGAIDADMTFELVEMSAKRTRLHAVSNVKPLTLTAKLFIQSLRLARARADRRYAQRMQQLALDIEDRYRGDQKAS